MTNPSELIEQFIRAVDRWELDTKGDTEEIVINLYKMRDSYDTPSVGFRFITEAINYVEEKREDNGFTES